jgi:ribosomal protein L11 methyltransferase
LGKWPALDVTHGGDPDLTLALVDDFSPTAAEPRDDTLRIFFPTSTARDAAALALRAFPYRAQPVDVDDEDWARRSQENLKPVTVGRITIAPRGAPRTPGRDRQAGAADRPASIDPESMVIVIQPSMGFGTGHHATTRLCLRALQATPLGDRSVLDVGAGSGILAIAAVRLGAARAVGVDHDADAIHAANENLTLNEGVESVRFQVADLAELKGPSADVVTANLTGAALIRSAGRLLGLVQPDGILIVSGLLEGERDAVVQAFDGPGRDAPATIFWEASDEGWVALAMKKS